jgi:hypothetical protein
MPVTRGLITNIKRRRNHVIKMPHKPKRNYDLGHENVLGRSILEGGGRHPRRHETDKDS